MARYSVPLVNGQYVFEVADLAAVLKPFHQLMLSYDVAPVAGTYSLECQLVGDPTWRAVEDGQANPIIAGAPVSFYGMVRRYRITIAAVSGGSNLEVWIADANEWIGPGMPDGLFTGLRAITVQPYTEANVKNGAQFFARVNYPTADPLAANVARVLSFQTGAKTVLVKSRDVTSVGEEVTLEIFEGGTFTAGTGTAVTPRNFNRRNPVASTVSIRKDVTLTATGTAMDDPEYFYGSTNAPQRSPSAIPQGRERILLPNTTYLIRITSIGTGTSRFTYFLDWYEGDTDLPRT